MARGSIDDPIKVFRYNILIPDLLGNNVVAGFSEATIPSIEFDVVEYREGGMSTTPQKSPGLAKFDDLTLRRGQYFRGNDTVDGLFYNWASRVYDLGVTGGTFGTSSIFRVELTIMQYRNDGNQAARWAVQNAWPRRFKFAGDFNATSSENAIEEIVIVHEGFSRVG